ncbi:protein AKNAD1 [Eulemur rufifrons]|uniref:protein AKNAD1 n=1 Tax=Eulemur rufifrons TaxID=859984 RepID=UPI003742FE45
MDDTDFSEDTTGKQQEELPYDGGDCDFTSKNGTLDGVNPIVFTADGPQEKATRDETCRNTAKARPLGKITENPVNKKHDKEEQCTVTAHIPADKGDISKSNISDISLHHLSQEHFLRGQGIDCETPPEISNADSFEEAAIVKNIISCYVENSWPKEQTSELTDQLNPKRDGENSNEPSCSLNRTEEDTSDSEEPVAAGDSSHQENSNFLTKIKGPSDKQKSCQGQSPQKQRTEKASSGSGFKCCQGHIHYRLPDFSKAAPKVKIPQNNVVNEPFTIAKQANFSPKLRSKSAMAQDPLETMPKSNCVEKQHEEQMGKITEPSQQLQMEPTARIHQELLTGIESETSLLKVLSTSQKDSSSSSSNIFQKISQGKQMCQKLKEQTDQLKTKVQEFSKRIKQDSPCHLQDKRMVLEHLQGHLELLEQKFLGTQDTHLALQQHTHEHESATIGDFDPERRVEGEILKLEMLLEEVKEKLDESKNSSSVSLPASSPGIPDSLASGPSSLSNEDSLCPPPTRPPPYPQAPAHPPTPPSHSPLTSPVSRHTCSHANPSDQPLLCPLREVAGAEGLEYADNVHLTDRSMPVGTEAVPREEPEWEYQPDTPAGPEGRKQRDRMLQCVLAGLQAAAHRAVNYDKLKKITQRADENPAAFLSRLVDALIQYTRLNATSPVGTTVLATRFITQSSPDIRKKLKEAEEGPQTPIQDLVNMAFKVFNSRDEQAEAQEEARVSQKTHLQAQSLVAALRLGGTTKPSTWSKVTSRTPPGTCFKCDSSAPPTASPALPSPTYPLPPELVDPPRWEDPNMNMSRQLTWTVLPQGFRDSPHLFGQALAQDLLQCRLQPSTVLQYVDDLSLCSPSYSDSRTQTASLLNFLAPKGYRMSPSKVQLSKPTVTYLGLSLTPTSCHLTVDRQQALHDLQPPTTAEQILSFLGLPHPEKPFNLYTDEHQGLALGVLTQPLGPTPISTPVAYLSKQLDTTVCGWPLLSPRLSSGHYSHQGEMVKASTSPKLDLSDKPLPTADLTFFVDGSSVTGEDDKRRAAYAIVSAYQPRYTPEERDSLLTQGGINHHRRVGPSKDGKLALPKAQALELIGQSGDGRNQPDQTAMGLSSDSREDLCGTLGTQEHAETTAPSLSCASCCWLLQWKQKMEKKGHRRINLGGFSIVIQEKALRSDSALSSNTAHSFCSDPGTGWRGSKCEDCSTKIPNSRRVCSKEPPKEFHYRYNTLGQNYLNRSERGAFVQPRSLDESKTSSPYKSHSKPKWICSQRVNSKSFQGERAPTPGKKNLQAFVTYSSDSVTPSPHFHSRGISGRKSLCDVDGTEETKSEVSNLALDHALKTATNLKETTNQMIKTIAEDLAKARKWRNRPKY